MGNPSLTSSALRGRAWLARVLLILGLCLATTTAAYAINAYVLSKPVPATVTISLPGDVNRDGIVDHSDLEMVASVFNTQPPALPAADINQDGIVDIHDLVIVGINYGRSQEQ